MPRAASKDSIGLVSRGAATADCATSAMASAMRAGFRLFVFINPRKTAAFVFRLRASVLVAVAFRVTLNPRSLHYLTESNTQHFSLQFLRPNLRIGAEEAQDDDKNRNTHHRGTHP